MSARTKRMKKGVGAAVTASLVLILVGVLGYKVEGADAQDRPDGVGAGMPWSHELHARHPDFSCQSCHHKSRPGEAAMQPCGSCHKTSPDLGQPQPTPNKAGDRRTSLHASCIGCHKAVEQGPTKCENCHEPGHGTKACATCHGSTLEQLVAGGHAFVACETCHSSLARNIENDRHVGTVPNAGTPAGCLSCHGREERDAAGMPTKNFAKCPINGRVKLADEGQCRACHNPHSPRTNRRRPIL